MRYCLLQSPTGLEFIRIPTDYMYQFIALLHRLHKEIDKLSTPNKPVLPTVIAECSELELLTSTYQLESGLAYINRLEKKFASITDDAYPLISLLTEIRAFQAQLEYLLEEGEF